MTDSFVPQMGRRSLWLTSSLLLCLVTTPIATKAQVIPDATLPANTVVTPQGNTSIIGGGTQVGGNLFHSFSSFSIPTGNTAFFDNAVTIDNIISRVTGNNISNIDGIIRANGTANLFLLNPNGIVFGPNARLDIGGSFIGSTADRINFADGSSFSATEANAPPLLTVNLPVGLQWGVNSGAIVNQSQVTNDSGDTVGLAVRSGQTLALMGGEVTLEGGYLSAPEGRVELAGVGDNSQVNLTETENSLAFGYEGVESFRDVQLSQGAVVDVSGSPSGSVQVQAQRFFLSDRSRIISINSGSQPGGGISIDATDSVELTGTGNYVADLVGLFENGVANNSDLPSGLFSSSVGVGRGGDVAVDTRQFAASNNAFIYAIAESSGGGGDITINASDSIQLSAASIRAVVFFDATGEGGDLTVNTGRLFMQEAAEIVAVVEGIGSGGDVTVNASESIELVGTNLVAVPVSNGFLVTNTGLFAAADVGSSGDAGELRVSTKQLTVRDGAWVVVNSVGEGQPGNLNLVATESAEFIGASPGEFSFPSSIQAAIGPLSTSGASGGNARITTRNLILRNEGSILAINQSLGDGGRVEIEADSLLLENEAAIEATTFLGDGGSISLRTQTLQLRDNSRLTVTAGIIDNPSSVSGVGDGGNITIDTDTLVALENSDITANAQEGFGGRVSIMARGIFGTQFREVETPQSDITATSALGAEFSGIVEISTPEVDTSSALIDLPENVTDSAEQIAPGCAADVGNTFTIAGRGGLPEDPVSGLRGRAVWWDSRDSSQIGNQLSIGYRQPTPLPQPTRELIEATGWVIDADGRVELVAELSKDSSSWYTPADCHRSEARRTVESPNVMLLPTFGNPDL